MPIFMNISEKDRNSLIKNWASDIKIALNDIKLS